MTSMAKGSSTFSVTASAPTFTSSFETYALVSMISYAAVSFTCASCSVEDSFRSLASSPVSLMTGFSANSALFSAFKSSIGLGGILSSF